MKNPSPPVRVPIAESGFTILELMITVSVLAILLGVGVPSFTAAIRQNRLAAETNDILAATAVARSEAVKRGALVSICAANDTQTACATADNQWSNGWLVFSDEKGDPGKIDGDGTLPDDTIIQVWPATMPQQITVQNAVNRFISYRGDGSTTLAADAVFAVVPATCVNPDGARTVTVDTVGRASSAKTNCLPR
jgi:type IV fimbrial biogenesis protein FimT